MIDILLQEQGSGGEIIVRSDDIVTVKGYENVPFLCMFGGYDFWANDLLLTGNERMMCLTERALAANPLTPAGRVIIEQAIVDDLAVITDEIPGTVVTVLAVIAAPNRLNVTITINGETFYMNWHPDTSYLEYFT